MRQTYHPGGDRLLLHDFEHVKVQQESTQDPLRLKTAPHGACLRLNLVGEVDFNVDFSSRFKEMLQIRN